MSALVYAKINKETLQFIRSTKQVSFGYVEKVTKFSEEKVAGWEDVSSEKLPTINQAKKLAECYRVPFAGFYMNSSDINIKYLPKIVNKRSMINSKDDNSSVNLALLDLINERDFYVEIIETFREVIPKFEFHISEALSVVEWAKSIRDYFDISLLDQYKCTSKRKFFLYVREKIESKGIFIQGFQKVDIETLRGVAIVDDSMPIIGINDDDRYPAKSFSIIHELVHIIKRTSSMCNDMMSSAPWDKEEIFCNAVAGEVLVPKEALCSKAKKYTQFSVKEVDSLATKFSVSSEVIIRRLFDTKIIEKKLYEVLSDELVRRFNDDREIQKNKVKMGLISGPKRNMSMEAIDGTSTSLCNALFKGYSEGVVDKSDISAHIRIGQRHINKFLSEVMKWYL